MMTLVGSDVEIFVRIFAGTSSASRIAFAEARSAYVAAVARDLRDSTPETSRAVLDTRTALVDAIDDMIYEGLGVGER